MTLNPAIDQTLSIANFAVGRVNRVDTSHQQAGGKGVNVAVMLADLGADVIATGLLGERNADPFESLFRQKGIEDRFVRIAGETRVGLKIIDEVTADTTDINFPGLYAPGDATHALLQIVKALVGPGTWVVLAGSMPPGMETTFYGELIDAIKAAGGHIALDTSGEPLTAALQHAPDLAKPNLAELAELVGRKLSRPADIVTAARETMISLGVRLAAISMGGDGAIFITANRAIRAVAPSVTVKSTVGAGDAMVAGLVFAMSRGLRLEEAAQLSTALGTYAVTRVESGLGDANAYRQYVDRVQIESIGIT